MKSFSAQIKEELINIKIKSEEERKAFVRGAFLSSGYITNPEVEYHLEMVVSNEEFANVLQHLIEGFGLNPKVILRKNKFIVYLKDSNEISDFLILIGAKKSVLDFEGTRVLKDVRNQINRQVNYETANLNKTINTAVRQIEDIKYLKKTGKFSELSENEKQVAEIRLKNPEATLTEIGELCNPKLSKSGVSHRMKNISKLV